MLPIPRSITVDCFSCSEEHELFLGNSTPNGTFSEKILKYQNTLRYGGFCGARGRIINRTLTPSELLSYEWNEHHGVAQMDRSAEHIEWLKRFVEKWRTPDLTEPKDWLFYTKTTANDDLIRVLLELEKFQQQCLASGSSVMSSRLKALKEAIYIELEECSEKYSA